jgi:galactose oxidase-like protein
VMYEPGKILVAGGGDSSGAIPQNSAETIDLSKTAPTWRSIAPMAFNRQNHNATLLPTGEVLVLGGTSIGFNDPAGSVHAAEVWNPTTGVWTTLASNTVARMYHSTAVLLPDGRVLHTGSGEGKREVNQRNAEIFSPPYLFKGSRPTIAGAPASVSYGETFNVQSPEAEDITDVTWVRLGATTHAFDENQRFNRLKFTAGSSALSVKAPADPNLAPPGHYMMFILDGEGVPSRAKIVHIE